MEHTLLIVLIVFGLSPQSCSVSAGEKEKCSEAEPTLDFLSLEADLEKVGSLLGGSWEYWWWVFLLPGFWMLHSVSVFIFDLDRFPAHHRSDPAHWLLPPQGTDTEKRY
ncbi:hypothetical protein ILYODFUR_010355 [Ilyodon furcidens]|uniref:Uncharacterized protein n=1 Tax=Ilyodon furcidens TaxID=33524 RepID=A0ABV0T7Y4_9TELE